mgnify:CR=1 FL=1|tara:strand:+ start:2802 stop:3398 length:597 start_codon:yes stop_codon:yes gene_type:complete
MPDDNKNPWGYTIAGILFITIGLSVFTIRLAHAGPYVMPQGAGFVGALAAIVIGGFLLWKNKPRFSGWIAIALATVASLPAIYSIGGEAQEVISLYALDAEDGTIDLRLWIVDREDGAWVGMGREKAVRHKLDGARLEMLRDGKMVCVTPILYEDRTTVREIHAMKVQKYKTAQIAGAVGLYPLQASPSTVALRLDPC